MSDGRLFTDFAPRCVRNLKYATAGVGSQDLRLYLINNGTKIMEADREAAAKAAFCAPCKTPYMQGTMAPETDRFVCDKVSCSRVPVPLVPGAQPGIAFGTGREYGSLGGDQAFLQSQIAAQAKYAGSQSQDPAGAFPGTASTPPGPARWAVPGGGGYPV
jgi:hypothetical protein